MLVTFTELGARNAAANRAVQHEFHELSGWDGAAVHCGAAMDLVTPAVGPAAAAYTFQPDGAGAVQLPPVWRCGCGFQLDAWFYSPSPYASHGRIAGSGAPHSRALSA